jgi:hypothetical protein
MANCNFALLACLFVILKVRAQQSDQHELHTQSGTAKSCSADAPDKHSSLLQLAGHMNATVASEHSHVEGCTFWSGGNLLDQLAAEAKYRTLNGCVRCESCCAGWRITADEMEEFKKEIYNKGKELKFATYEEETIGVFDGTDDTPRIKMTEEHPPSPMSKWRDMSKKFAETCSSTVNYMFGLPYVVDNRAKLDKIKNKFLNYNVFVNVELVELVKQHGQHGGHVTVNIYETHLFTALSNDGVDDVLKNREAKKKMEEAAKWVFDHNTNKPTTIKVDKHNLEDMQKHIAEMYAEYLKSWHSKCDRTCQSYWDVFKHFAPTKESELGGNAIRVLMDMGAVQTWITHMSR